MCLCIYLVMTLSADWCVPVAVALDRLFGLVLSVQSGEGIPF